MKRIISVILALAIAVSAAVCLSVGIGASGERIQTGIKLTFTNVGASSSGNFFLGALGRQLVFEDNGVKDISVYFTNEGADPLSVVFRGVSSDWATQRFQKNITLAAGETQLVEIYNVNVTSTDQIYFYISGLKNGSALSFKPNYVTLDYSGLSKSSMNSELASGFDLETVTAEQVKLNIPAQSNVSYALCLKDSFFAYKRGVASLDASFAKGTPLKVYASLNDVSKPVYTGIAANGELICDSTKKEAELTLNADTVLSAVLDTEGFKQNGISVAFNNTLTATDGNFYLTAVEASELLTDNSKLSMTLFNEGTNKITACVCVINNSWVRLAGGDMQEINAGESGVFDISNITLEGTGNKVYFYVKNLETSSRFRAVINNKDIDYTQFISGLSGTGDGTFTATANTKKAYKLTLDAVEGATYSVFMNGSSIPVADKVTSFEMPFAEGTGITVKAYGNIESITLNGNKTDGNTASATVSEPIKGVAALKAEEQNSDTEEKDKEQTDNGVEIEFLEKFESQYVNLFLSAPGIKNLTFDMDKNGTCLSVTLYNEGGNAVKAGAILVKNDFSRIQASDTLEIKPGEYKTFEFMNLKLQGNEILYFNLLNAEKGTKLRAVFNQASPDYSLYTNVQLNGSESSKLAANVKKSDKIRLRLEKSSNMKYTVSVNGSIFASYTAVEQLDTFVAEGTDVEVIAVPQNDSVFGIWSNSNKNKTVNIKSIEKDTVLTAYTADNMDGRKNTGDTGMYAMAVILLASSAAVCTALKKRKSIED